MGTYGSTWEVGGYCGRGSVGELANSLTGRAAVVCGNAEHVFYEFEDTCKKLGHPVVFGVNDVGMYLPRMDHWVSLHADNLGAWKAVRWQNAFSQEKTQYHSVTARPVVDHLWEGLTPLFCLSGYFAMQIAHIMGASPIVLCGCPGEAGPRFFESHARPDFGYGSGTAGGDSSIRTQLEHEMKRLPEFKAKVRSMSGWTREFFGSL